jgi:hypothetical protein
MGRIRLHVALDCSACSFETFILDNIESGATIAIDSWQADNVIDKERYSHDATNLGKSGDRDHLYDGHLVTTLIKRLIRVTFHGRFEPKYLQNCLDGYVEDVKGGARADSRPSAIVETTHSRVTEAD